MKKELLCPKCAEVLRKSFAEQRQAAGGTVRFTYGHFKKETDAHKLACVSCGTPFKAREAVVCFSNWEKGDFPEPWEGELITEERSEQL